MHPIKVHAQLIPNYLDTNIISIQVERKARTTHISE